MKKTIYYNSIPNYCDSIDKNKRSTVILSRFQAFLYKNIIKNRVRPLRGLTHFFDQIVFFGSLACVLIFARNLLLLEYFYIHNEFNKELIKFIDLGNGMVMLIFNPNAKEDFYFD